MSNISPQMVKTLRERSGVGMSKCKDALVEADGNLEKAVEILRKKGLASAVKKEGRETKEGKIGTFETDDALVLLEVNTETDFVAKNEKFQKFVVELAEQAAKSKPNSLESFVKESYAIDPSLTIEEYRNLLIQSIGENIKISKLEIIHKDKNSSYGIYSHMNGKILTVTEVKGSDNEQTLAKDISMHIAAENPEFLSENEVPKNVKKKEEEIARSQIKDKPEFVIEKIIQGKIKSYLEQNCLLNQKYIKDTAITVSQLLEKRSKEINKDLSITSFYRWNIG